MLGSHDGCQNIWKFYQRGLQHIKAQKVPNDVFGPFIYKIFNVNVAIFYWKSIKFKGSYEAFS